jgi:NAD-dependent deacetylase
MYAWANGVSRVAVLTGAGVSTDSGIPDYRGPSGVWTRDPSLANAFTYKNFMADATTRQRFWQAYVDHAAWRAEPNEAHRAIAALERTTAIRVLTQNVDGLHQRAGSSPRKVLELHGTMHEVVCTGCGKRMPSQETLKRVENGENDPRCADCGGVLKLAVVMFGQHLDGETASLAQRVAAHSGLFLAVGTSLQVEPVASLCAMAVNAGNRLVIVNRDPTPYDDLADEVIREPIAVVVPEIARVLAAARGST